MKKLIDFLSVLMMAAAVAFSGCEKTSEKGGPDAINGESPNGKVKNGAAENEDATFTISVPEETMEIEQGAERVVEVKVDRSVEFDQKVTLKVEAPEGITAEPEGIILSKNSASAEITLKAAADVAEGEKVVTVKGQPETGKSVDLTFKLKITKAEK